MSRIGNKAMLAELTIRKWGASKSDRKASNEFAASKHSNPTMSKVTKTLLQSPHLVGFDQLGNAARNVHYNFTMPWLDNGMRILPTKKFLEYGRSIKDISDRSAVCIDNFCESYEELIKSAEGQLGGLFNITDYPAVEKVREKFGIQMRFLPIPQENDWRVDLGEEDVKRLQEELKVTFGDSQNRAIDDLVEKVRERLERLQMVLADPDDMSFKRRLRENHISGLVELPDFIDTMNVFDNQKLSNLAESLATKLDFNFDADGLKDDPALKARVLMNVNELLADLGVEG